MDAWETRCRRDCFVSLSSPSQHQVEGSISSKPASGRRQHQLQASGGDLAWNFILKPNLAGSHIVRAIEIRLREPKLIHHANVIVDRLGTVSLPFAGMDVAVPREPLDLDGHFFFFKPGAPSFAEPDGFGWRLDPPTTLILNTHIQPSGQSVSEQPSIEPYLLQLESDDALKIPAAVADFTVSDDIKLPIDTDVLAIHPHVHYLGKRLEAYATLPNGERKWLICIASGDPNWQSVYRYNEPIVLPAGTVVSMRFHYDNSAANPRNPNRPPKRVEAAMHPPTRWRICGCK